MSVIQYRQLPKKWTPDKPQLTTVKYLIEHACAGLLLDPGFGKTACTLAAFTYLKEKGLANRMLILAPARVMDLVWPAEIKKWKDFSGLTFHVLHGANKEEELWDTLDVDVIITNFESLKWLMNIETIPHKNNPAKKSVKVDKRRFRKLGFDTLVIDELSKFKHSGSIRYKTLKQVVHMFARRWGLTGSPAANGLMGLFAQCFILDEGHALGKFITHYRRIYFDKDEYGYGYEPKDGAVDKIYKKIAPLMLRIDEKEAKVKLPKAVPRNIYIDLPDKARRVYQDLESDLVSRVDGKLITAANAATASMKCRQVTSGGVYIEPDIEEILSRHKVPQKTKAREAIHLHDAKTEALAEFIEELEGQPVLIAYDFKHDLDRIANMKINGKKRYPKGVPYIGGGTTKTQSKELEQKWLAGEITELYGHPQSIAHGLNLQHWGEDDYPRHVLWYSLTWDYELYDQFIRRVRRRGNMASRVFVHHLLARNTIDEYILGVLYSKRRTQNALFQALKELREARFDIAA